MGATQQGNSPGPSGDLWVDRGGLDAGAPIIFVHGLGATAQVFDALLPAFETSYFVVRFDLRGHGRSGRGNVVSLADWADDLDRILDSLPASSASFVADGLGALILEHFVATRPNRVDRLVLINPLRGLDNEARGRFLDRAGQVRLQGLGDLADDPESDFGSAKLQDPVAVERRKAMVEAQPPERYAQACETIAASHTSDLRNVETPVLILSGSAAFNSSNAAQLLETLPNASLQVLDGVGDWPALEFPGDVAVRIKTFLERHARSDGVSA